MTMLEKIVWALRAELRSDRAIFQPEEGGATVSESAIARAVLQAVREPTEAMRNAYNAVAIENEGPAAQFMSHAWEAAIDTALEEG